METCGLTCFIQLLHPGEVTVLIQCLLAACSLTVGEVSERSFNVYLIPETLRVTVSEGFGSKGLLALSTETRAIRVLPADVQGGRRVRIWRFR